jgi:hypothetical protein
MYGKRSFCYARLVHLLFWSTDLADLSDEEQISSGFPMAAKLPQVQKLKLSFQPHLYQNSLGWSHVNYNPRRHILTDIRQVECLDLHYRAVLSPDQAFGPTVTGQSHEGKSGRQMV